jgi:hypothetical protein
VDWCPPRALSKAQCYYILSRGHRHSEEDTTPANTISHRSTMKTPIAKWIQGITIVSNACRFAVLADTTTSFSPSCIPGSPQTAFPNCDHFLNFGNTCPYLSTDQAREECLCNQDYVNSLFGYEFHLPTDHLMADPSQLRERNEGLL